MLLRPGRMQKPTVVRYVDEEVRAFEDELPGQVANRVFETDQWRNPNVAIGKAENGVIGSWRKISGHPRPSDDGKEGKRTSCRNVLAKRNQVDFAINLHALTRFGDKNGRVVVAFAFKIQRAKKQVSFAQSTEVFDKPITLTVLVTHRIGH